MVGNHHPHMVITVHTPGNVDPFDSYGLICCELIRHLTRLGRRVNVIAGGHKRLDTQDEEVAAITALPPIRSQSGIFLGYPTSYVRYNTFEFCRPRVAVSMFESSRIPADWPHMLNQCEAVVVPTDFCRDVFLESGVGTDVFAIPLGIHDVYQPAPRDPNRPFTFLSFLDRGKRKGGLFALQAFLQAFGNNMDYKLILKARHTKRSLTIVNPNVEVVQDDLSEEELYRLYLQCDVMLNPNMGEGFGLIPREFAATGGTALATAWGGTAEGIDVWGIPLPYTLVPADWAGHPNLAGQPLGDWAQPDISGIVEIMRDVADNRESYMQRAMKNAPIVRQMYSWNKFAQDVLKVWQDHGYWS